MNGRGFLLSRLQWRIWLAVMAAVVLTTVSVSMLMRHLAENQRQPRYLQIRDLKGRVLAQTKVMPHKRGLSVPVQTADGQVLEIEWLMPGVEPPPLAVVDAEINPSANGGAAPVVGALRFGIKAEPLTPPVEEPWAAQLWPPRGPLGLSLTLALLALAIGVGAYPVARRMTKRLERLQRSVESWGQGQLDVRAVIDGDDEVALLAQRFNEAAGRIEQLLQSHKSMLANTSHELRTPLARLRMAIELLGSKPITIKNRSEIERNIRELDELVEEILLRSRLDAQGQFAPAKETVDLVGLAAQECARYGVPLRTELQQAEIVGYEKLLQRLIRNLLQNAKRYGQNLQNQGEDFGLAFQAAQGQLEEGGEESPIEVHLYQAVTGGGFVLDVLDRGPGVPADWREKIFEPFFRLPDAAEREGGVGLGLALVRSIADHHAAQVSCLARSGGGSCFRVNFPARMAS